MFMYNNEIRLNLQIGVLRDLYKRELITKNELHRCIEKITAKESKRDGAKTDCGVLQS